MNIFSCGFTVTHFSAFCVSALIFFFEGGVGGKESLQWNLLLVNFEKDFNEFVTLDKQKIWCKSNNIFFFKFS